MWVCVCVRMFVCVRQNVGLCATMWPAVSNSVQLLHPVVTGGNTQFSTPAAVFQDPVSIKAHPNK